MRTDSVTLASLRIMLGILCATLACYGCSRGNKHEPEKYQKQLDEANEMMFLADYNVAIGKLTEVIEMDENHTEAYDRRGFCHLQLKQFDEAIADFDAALQRNRQRMPTLFHRGEAHLAKKQFADAINDFSMAINVNPHDPRSYRYRASAYEGLGRKDKAEPDFRKARELEKKMGLSPTPK